MLKGYLNGQLLGSVEASGTIKNALNTNVCLMIGNEPTGALYAVQQTGFGWHGDIDEVEFYNRALTAAEIQAIFNAGSAGKCTVDQLLVQLNQCEQDLAAAEQESQSLQSQVDTLTTQNAQLQQDLEDLQSQLTQLTTTLANGLSDIEGDFRVVFNNPTFVIPGATLPEQYQNLLTAILNLNKGRKMGIYTNLGGMP